MMEMVYEDGAFTFTRNSGEKVKLLNLEVGFIAHESEKICWRGGISDAIDDDIDSLCFDDVTVEEFVQECVANIDDDWVTNDGFCDPDYSEYVFSNAKSMGIWRD